MDLVFDIFDIVSLVRRFDYPATRDNVLYMFYLTTFRKFKEYKGFKRYKIFLSDYKYLPEEHIPYIEAFRYRFYEIPIIQEEGKTSFDLMYEHSLLNRKTVYVLLNNFTYQCMNENSYYYNLNLHKIEEYNRDRCRAKKFETIIKKGLNKNPNFNTIFDDLITIEDIDSEAVLRSLIFNLNIKVDEKDIIPALEKYDLKYRYENRCFF
jgi:hypothetical protein